MARRSELGMPWSTGAQKYPSRLRSSIAASRHAVVGAGLAALGDARGGDLLHDRLERDGVGAHGARARHVADGAVADRGA